MNHRVPNLAITAAFCVGLSATSVLANFSDSFEGPLNTNFWSTELQSGYVVCPSSTRAHSGSNSLELATTDTGSDKNVRIYHTFAAPTYGTVSFWVYDTAAGFDSANSITFYVTRATSEVATIWTPDYGTSTYYWGALGAGGPTAIARSQAWHQFTISCLSGSTTLEIDGTVVYSGAGGQQFDRVDMDLSGISSRPAWSMQFDDFSYVAELNETNSPNLLKRSIMQGTTVSVGEVFSYEIGFDTFSNTVAAVALRVEDTLPAELELIGATTNGTLSATYDPATRTIVWDFGTWPPLTAGPTNYVTVRLTAVAIGQTNVINTASLVTSNLPPVMARATVAVGSNQPPVAVCNSLTVTNDPGLCSATVSAARVGAGSYDPEGGPLDMTLTPPGPFPVGTNIVLLTVSDTNGASASCTTALVVVDGQPPRIGLVTATPAVLWPPDHKLVEVTVNYTAADACDSSAGISRKLSVTCNEPVNGLGDGHTSPDWQVLDGHHLRLRAERAGVGGGRVYTITVICTDSSGNSAVKNVSVAVPKSQGEKQ